MSQKQKTHNHGDALHKETTGEKIRVMIISTVLTLIVFFIANLHFRNYIDTQTPNLLPLGAQTGSQGGYSQSTAVDDKYRWFIEDVIKWKPRG